MPTDLFIVGDTVVPSIPVRGRKGTEYATSLCSSNVSLSRSSGWGHCRGSQVGNTVFAGRTKAAATAGSYSSKMGPAHGVR